MKLEDVNQVARAHNLEERKSVNKTKLKLQELKTELRAINGKKGKKTFKQKTRGTTAVATKFDSGAEKDGWTSWILPVILALIITSVYNGYFGK